MARCFGVPALKMFWVSDVNHCDTVVCKTGIQHRNFHASRVCRRHMATQHDSPLRNDSANDLTMKFAVLHFLLICLMTSAALAQSGGPQAQSPTNWFVGGNMP